MKNYDPALQYARSRSPFGPHSPMLAARLEGSTAQAYEALSRAAKFTGAYLIITSFHIASFAGSEPTWVEFVAYWPRSDRSNEFRQWVKKRGMALQPWVPFKPFDVL